MFKSLAVALCLLSACEGTVTQLNAAELLAHSYCTVRPGVPDCVPSVMAGFCSTEQLGDCANLLDNAQTTQLTQCIHSTYADGTIPASCWELFR